MKSGLGRMPARMGFAFIFAVTLLIPDVISMSVYRSAETIDTTSASVTSEPEETMLDKYEAETNDIEKDYNEVGLTPLDDSPEFYETLSPLKEEATMSLINIGKEETNEEKITDLEEFPEESHGAEATTDEDESPAGLDELDEAEDDALDLMRLIVKRNAEEEEGEGEGEGEEEEEEEEELDEPKMMETIDEDEFSFSDLSKALEPLIQAFSNSESGPPSPDDFFSWLPALKKLLDPNEESSASKPTGVPSNRKSSFSTFPEPSLQIAPASPAAEPTESEDLPSPSLLEELTAPIPPTASMPPQPSQPSPSDVPDAE